MGLGGGNERGRRERGVSEWQDGRKKVERFAKQIKRGRGGKSARQQSHFQPDDPLFLSTGLGFAGNWGSTMCRATPPSCPWQTHNSAPNTHTHNKHTHRAPAQTHKTEKEKKKTPPHQKSVSLISALKQNEAPWNNESAERRRGRNADRNETVIRSYHFLIT